MKVAVIYGKRVFPNDVKSIRFGPKSVWIIGLLFYLMHFSTSALAERAELAGAAGGLNGLADANLSALQAEQTANKEAAERDRDSAQAQGNEGEAQEAQGRVEEAEDKLAQIAEAQGSNNASAAGNAAAEAGARDAAGAAAGAGQGAGQGAAAGAGQGAAAGAGQGAAAGAGQGAAAGAGQGAAAGAGQGAAAGAGQGAAAGAGQGAAAGASQAANQAGGQGGGQGGGGGGGNDTPITPPSPPSPPPSNGGGNDSPPQQAPQQQAQQQVPAPPQVEAPRSSGSDGVTEALNNVRKAELESKPKSSPSQSRSSNSSPSTSSPELSSTSSSVPDQAQLADLSTPKSSSQAPIARGSVLNKTSEGSTSGNSASSGIGDVASALRPESVSRNFAEANSDFFSSENSVSSTEATSAPRKFRGAGPTEDELPLERPVSGSRGIASRELSQSAGRPVAETAQIISDGGMVDDILLSDSAQIVTEKSKESMLRKLRRESKAGL